MPGNTLFLTPKSQTMVNCTLLRIPSEETQNLDPAQAIQYAAKKATEGGHDGAEVICLNTNRTYKGDPQTVVKTIVNLRVFKGIRSDNNRIHSAVPGVPQVFILK